MTRHVPRNTLVDQKYFSRNRDASVLMAISNLMKPRYFMQRGIKSRRLEKEREDHCQRIVFGS